MSDKKIVHKIEEGMNREDVLCTTYQMRNFFTQFRDGFFAPIDNMNYIQHYRCAEWAKKDFTVVDVCCGRSLMLPLLRYHAKDIKKYIGVDISETNIKEAHKWHERQNKTIEEYYPFKVEWILSDVAEMSKHIPDNSVDLIIYTSALEHMHPEHGHKSLVECFKMLKQGGKMVLSCPNTYGDGYDTQYKAHVFEWDYNMLNKALDEIGFVIQAEYGIVANIKELEKAYEARGMGDYFAMLREYIPTVFLPAYAAVPFPEISKEILFVLSKGVPQTYDRRKRREMQVSDTGNKQKTLF